MMRIQTLVVTTDQQNHNLLNRMNIQTDAIIGNQCDRNEVEEFDYNGHHIKWLSFKERGVGLNRNNVLMRSNADICVFADDDMVLHEGYDIIVRDLFEKYPKVDVLLFNLDEKIPKRYKNTKYVKINKLNYGKYGAARLAIRVKSIHMAGIHFNLLFGGGTKYSCGEDSIFLHDCLKKKLKIMAVPIAIAEVLSERDSTWFVGYNDKLFIDKGIFYWRLYGRLSRLIAAYVCIKHANGRYSEYGWKNAYKKMLEGIKSQM